MSEPTVSAGYPRALLDFAVSRGADRDELRKRSGLSERDLAEPDNRIALARYLALFEAAIALCQEPALALHFGERVRMQDVSIVGLICEAAETTAEVGRQLNRYGRLAVDEDRGAELIRVEPDGGGRLWMHIGGAAFAQNRWMIEAEFARLIGNARSMFGSTPAFQAMKFPVAAHFAYPEPTWRAEYERIFDAPLVFGAERSALLIDQAFLTLKQPPTNRYVFGVLCERADALLNELEAQKSTKARVERLLMPILHTGDATMDVIANKMGLSRRTLQRRLSEEGTSLAKVLDELRHRLALDYLHAKKVSVNEIAYLVGFSDPAAFSRAFKRWTGSSPRAMRAAQTQS